jgi:signal peptidase I
MADAMAAKRKPRERLKEKDTKRDPKEAVLKFLKEAGIIFGIFIILNSFVFASFVVPTGSMEDTVLAGDFLFVNKFIYGGSTPRHIFYTSIRIPYFSVPGFRDVRRGDVIVFEFPGLRDEVQPDEFNYYLKRCVALSGDTLEIRNRVLYVNGEEFPRPKYMRTSPRSPIPPDQADPRVFPRGYPWNEDNYGPLYIPGVGDTLHLTAENFHAWRIFMLREGAEATMQNDGTIMIDGEVTERYIVKRDYMFGIGDNRNNSLDSRFFGLIAKDLLIGSPMVVYLSWDPHIPFTNIFSKIGSVRWGRFGKVIR